MPTREYSELVSTVAETLEHVLPVDPAMTPDQVQMTDAPSFSWPAHSFVLDGEKIVWHFPDAPSRLIEENG